MKCETCCTAGLNTRPTKSNSVLMCSCVYFRSGLCCTTRPFPPCCGSGWQPGTFINRWPRRLLRTRTGIHLCPLSNRSWSKQRCSNVFLFFMLLILCGNALALPVLPTALVEEHHYLQKLHQSLSAGWGSEVELDSSTNIKYYCFAGPQDCDCQHMIQALLVCGDAVGIHIPNILDHDVAD